MKRFALPLLLLTSVSLFGSAHAGTGGPTGEQLKQMVRSTVVVPVEWDGTYDTVDSAYICEGALQSTSTAMDTICGGKDYSPNQSGSPVQFNCSGSANATTFDMTCIGSTDVYAGCTAYYTVVTHGTLSSGTYFIVSTINVTYSGIDPLCSYYPPSCNQYNSHGTRTGPAPAGYCSTPTRRTTWGQVKFFYR
jgi:hypothetical protein